ncbi:MAG: methyltransferase family protein [Sulfuricaulis sp.]
MKQRRKSFIARGGLWVLAQALIMLLAFVIPVRFGVGRLIPDQAMSLAGVMVTVSGLLLAIWGLATLGDALTPFPIPLDEASFHRQGAYKLMRHPIYSGLMLTSIGWDLWWLSPSGFLYALMLVIFFDRKAAYEERWLQQKYNNYADYMRAIKKFIPGVY